MNITYKVQGADGQEFGPATLEQLLGWLRENRVGPDSQVMRNDMSHWAAARDFSELQPAFVSAPPAITPPVGGQRVAADPALLSRVKSGASWFYWIAALSLINSIVAATGSDWRFILGLGVTQVIDEIGQGVGGAGKVVGLGLALVVASVFVLFGVFANKRQSWAFIVGMILFGLDGLLSLLAQDWLSLGFHAYALFWIFRGFKASRGLDQA